MDTSTAYHRILARLGSDDPSERRQAMLELDVLATSGHVPAMCRLGTRLVEDPDAATQSRGAELLRRAAEAGNAKAQFRFGLLLTHGRAGVTRDPLAAGRWCRAAAEQGLAEAQYNLGLLLATGTGVDADATAAGHWLRMAAINGLDEASGCLDLIYRDPDERPRTWDDADTRLSVVLTPSESGKPLRFAEFYLDPCLDLLMQRFHIEMAEAEDIVQQFFLELEEPLAKGKHRGRRWLEALRERYDSQRGSFRPFLGTVLGNFARDWIRRRSRDLPGPSDDTQTDPQIVLDHHAEAWHRHNARLPCSVPSSATV
jgi:TPR repeat protein